MRKLLIFILTLTLFMSVLTCNASQASAKADPSKKAILVVSFGTSYNDTRENTIGAIEKQIAAQYPDYEVRRAFTSQIIINKLLSRDGIKIDNLAQAMERLAADGISTVIVQPTHVMNGYEYEEMKEAVKPYEDKFVSVKYGAPLLNSVEDYKKVIAALAADLGKLPENEAVVLMGHGTEHYANAAYSALDYMFKDLGYGNIFVGTVESYPSLDTVLRKVWESGVKKVRLLPLMIVAGDHATNDMAGDEEYSWKNVFKSKGYEVDCIIKGIGEYQAIRDIFVEHVGAAIKVETE
ncbi:MAG TPA: sirohydrochlorin cobaltochelatase [Clostridia bacterium]|nr:sirohydrochlorin cobaltochelatase [Clostridia bacterium]